MEANGCQQKRGVNVKFASKLDFSTEAFIAYPGLGPPGDFCTLTDEQHDRELPFIALSMISTEAVLWYLES